MRDKFEDEAPTTPVPPSSKREPPSGARRSGSTLALKPHQHLATADRAIRELKRELLEKTRALKTHADDLERATTEALRMQADMVVMKKELEASRDREGESARQWIAMSAELGSARARLERYERVLKRLRERAESIRDRARDSGAGMDAEVREILAMLELHAPEADK